MNNTANFREAEYDFDSAGYQCILLCLATSPEPMTSLEMEDEHSISVCITSSTLRMYVGRLAKAGLIESASPERTHNRKWHITETGRKRTLVPLSPPKPVVVPEAPVSLKPAPTSPGNQAPIPHTDYYPSVAAATTPKLVQPAIPPKEVATVSYSGSTHIRFIIVQRENDEGFLDMLTFEVENGSEEQYFLRKVCDKLSIPHFIMPAKRPKDE